MELTHSQAANIIISHDWTVLFSLLEFAATSRSPSRGGQIGSAPSHHVIEVGVATESEKPDIESALVRSLNRIKRP